MKQQQQQPASYGTVTIDTSHRVADHYDVHEQLGV